MAGPDAIITAIGSGGNPARGPRSVPTQLALALDHGESHAREDFLAGPSNAAALALIERWPDWPARTVLLRGPEGSGKSHLAAIWARMSGARMLSPRSLDGAEVPIALATGALVLENLAEVGFDEAALFHLINLAREERAYVLITARSAPAGWRIALPDLASRLRALPVVSLSAPDDALLRAVIVKLFADRQLSVDESVVAYLATRIERSFAAARAAVDALDREALRLQRPVTRALAGELFREP
jgi:chromosomal replication initiation ATPase DnaA